MPASPPWDHADFRVPTALQVTETPLRRVLIVGSCMVEGFPEWLVNAQPRSEADYVLFNNASELPKSPPRPAADYDFQILQIPLRSLIPEHQQFRLGFDDIAGYEALFETSVTRLQHMLEAGLAYHERYRLLTFVTNLLVPQSDQIGRLMPRADLRNSSYFVRKLNDVLAAEVDRRQNCFLLDVDAISASLGRSTVQDDSLWTSVHGSVLGDWDYERDSARIEPILPVSSFVPIRTHDFLTAMWRESVAMFRTLRQIDSIKLVIIDLDDTIWRGVLAETSQITTDTTEGWPNGIVEALLALKRRGILLAIVSKNTEELVSRLWPDVFGDKLLLGDFASIKINWEPKAENVAAVLEEINVLPSSVLFIDDNPVERAAVKAAFPAIRVLGRDPYEIRRVLLWSPETQVAAVTSESTRRTEMVQAQIRRDGLRSRMTREEFLASLDVRVAVDRVSSTSNRGFARALELINKTNQFNSTGERWTMEQASTFFEDGGRFFVFTVRDSFTDYGLTAVAIEASGEILQLVMSCRVLGLDVEKAIFRQLQDVAHEAGKTELRIRFASTASNSLVKDALQKNAFEINGEWCTASPGTEFAGAARLEIS